MRSTPLRTTLEAIAAYEGDETDLLAELVQELRPAKPERLRREVPKVASLIVLQEHDEALRSGLSAYVTRMVGAKSLSHTITDAGIPSGSFWHELKQRLAYKILPFQPGKDTLDHVLINVFFREKDSEWVDSVPPHQGKRLLELLGGDGLDMVGVDSFLVQELLFAAKILGLRIAGRAFDAEVLRMVPEHANFQSPFVLLGDELDGYLEGLRKGSIERVRSSAEHQRVLDLMRDCRSAIATAYANSERFGITFRVNQQLLIMERMLERVSVVLNALALDPGSDGMVGMVDLVKELVRFNAGRTHVSSFVASSTQVVAREITQHTGRKGEHYITSTPKEYRNMLRTALGGGAIVAVACMLKAWYGSLEGSLFFHALLYSMNYAMAFIAIYLLHLTLATKQPAMTAATIAAALDDGRDDPHERRYDDLAELVARVWRSQFIAFVGNVAMAFPVAVALAYGWEALFGAGLLAHNSEKMLHELDPLTSLALPHAAIAGIFLFLSGLIAGSVTNKSVHKNVPERIEQHPVLKFMLSQRHRRRLAVFYDAHAGGIISNFWFGVFMGSIGTVGIVLGLPLDIRHITFAAGNLGLGLVGADWHVSAWTLVAAIIGVGLIGLFNFTVSFALSLALAMRSRGTPYAELLPIASAVRKRFSKASSSFFFPPRTEGSPRAMGAKRT